MTSKRTQAGLPTLNRWRVFQASQQQAARDWRRENGLCTKLACEYCAAPDSPMCELHRDMSRSAKRQRGREVDA